MYNVSIKFIPLSLDHPSPLLLPYPMTTIPCTIFLNTECNITCMCHPLEQGWPCSLQEPHPPRKVTSLPQQPSLPDSSSAGCGNSWASFGSTLAFLAGLFPCRSVYEATAALSSWMQRPHHVQQIVFPHRHPGPDPYNPSSPLPSGEGHGIEMSFRAEHSSLWFSVPWLFASLYQLSCTTQKNFSARGWEMYYSIRP